MSTRQAPLYCPYCAGEDLRPNESETAAWECRECLRVFALKVLGISQPMRQDSGAPL